MIKKLVCLECPEGCRLTVNMDGSRIIDITGNKCPKGEKDAVSEVENPARILTATVLAEGLDLKMVPVRTDKPLPKTRLFEAMGEVKKIKVDKPLNTGDIIVKDFLGTGVNLIATRRAK